MANYLNVNSWNRKDHFHFFKHYDNPFFNICTDVDVTNLRQHTKENNLSFFLSSLYLSLKAANQVEEFRYRIRGDQVIIHDVIHAGSTVLNENGETFSFCYFDYYPEFCQFFDHASRMLKSNKDKGGKLESRDHLDNLLHYSTIPWISFTSISHPRKFGGEDSIPKIVFGKFYKQNKNFKMPISVEVHHSLMDALHVARFLEKFQNYLCCTEVFQK